MRRASITPFTALKTKHIVYSISCCYAHSIDDAHNIYKYPIHPFQSMMIQSSYSSRVRWFVYSSYTHRLAKFIRESTWESSYYRLGKKRPSSGNFVRVSLSALSFHINPVSPTITIPNTAVFPFQFEGWEYQPPAGDQTCLGYLKAAVRIEVGFAIAGWGLTESCRRRPRSC